MIDVTPSGVRNLCRHCGWNTPAKQTVMACFFGPRVGEHHVAGRFGDGGGRYRIYLDEQDISNDCTEALADRPFGKVMLIDRRGLCDECHERPAETLGVGAVRIERGVF